MSAEAQLNALLLAAPDVVEIVGTNIFHGIATAEDTPAISYMRDATEYNQSISGHAHEGSDRVLLNIFCAGKEVGIATLLADKVCEIPEIISARRNRSTTYEAELYAVVISVELWE